MATERDLAILPTGDHNPSRDHSPKLFIPTYDRSLWFFQYGPQVRTSIRILILVHNILNMNIQDCRDLVSKFVSSTFDGWPLPRRCGPRFVIPISKIFISIYPSICVRLYLGPAASEVPAAGRSARLSMCVLGSGTEKTKVIYRKSG